MSQSEAQKLIEDLETTGKIKLSPYGILELFGGKIVFSNPANLSAGSKILSADQALALIEKFIENKNKPPVPSGKIDSKKYKTFSKLKDMVK